MLGRWRCRRIWGVVVVIWDVDAGFLTRLLEKGKAEMCGVGLRRLP